MSHIDQGTLHAYVDGELRQDRLARVEAHLAGCPDCRRRLDEARAAVDETSRLMAELEPGPLTPPPWREIEERAGARRPSGRPRSWLRSSLAWAASIAVAFGLGWFSRSYWTTLPDPVQQVAREASAPAEFRGREGPDESRADRSRPLEAETRAPARAAEAQAPSPLADQAADEASGTAGTRGSEGLAQGQPEEPTATGAADISREAATRAERLAESRPAEPQEDARLAAREGPAKPDLPESDSAPTADPLTIPTTFEAARRRAADAVAGRSLTDPQPAGEEQARRARPAAPVADEPGAGRFHDISVEQARTWLGVPPRALPELRLTAVEVGPGASVPEGHPGLPAVRQTYEDEEGRTLVLVQQWIGSGPAADADARLLVEPSGVRTYIWYDPDGYRLSLTGTLGAESLRALAGRVR